MSEKAEETVVVSFVNDDGNMQLVTDGAEAECPACRYPERHRIIKLPSLTMIADGCPSCETSRMTDRENGSES